MKTWIENAVMKLKKQQRRTCSSDKWARSTGTINNEKTTLKDYGGIGLKANLFNKNLDQICQIIIRFFNFFIKILLVIKSFNHKNKIKVQQKVSFKNITTEYQININKNNLYGNLMIC